MWTLYSSVYRFRVETLEVTNRAPDGTNTRALDVNSIVYSIHEVEVVALHYHTCDLHLGCQLLHISLGDIPGGSQSGRLPHLEGGGAHSLKTPLLLSKICSSRVSMVVWHRILMFTHVQDTLGWPCLIITPNMYCLRQFWKYYENLKIQVFWKLFSST